MVAVQNQDEMCLASLLHASKELDKTESFHQCMRKENGFSSTSTSNK